LASGSPRIGRPAWLRHTWLVPAPDELPDDTNPMVFLAMLIVPMVVVAGLWFLVAVLTWGGA
jgi:hypothetical protein